MTSDDTGQRKRAPNRTDVAAYAGVSTAVVSYVVNDGPRPVAPATRDRVLAAMRTLNYNPNVFARAMRLQSATAVGLVVPDVSNTYFGSLAREVTNRAFDQGFAVLLGDADNDVERESAQIRSLIERRVDGLIIVSLEPSLSEDTADIPTVYLDHRMSSRQSVILIDNQDGARQAVEHLLGHGRRVIAHISGPEGAPGADDRVEGWRRTLHLSGETAGLAHLYPAEFSREGGYHAAHRMFASEQGRPDAVFVGSDVQALGLLKAARESGVVVPTDLSVISFDGTEDAVYSDPPLSSIEQPIIHIATSALAAVIRPAPGSVHTIPVRLVVRDSCGSHEV